jgi:PilZ domain-containing protein
MDEPRNYPRRRVLKSGIIGFGTTSVPCIVRNLSATGAALEINTPLCFSDRFTLIVPSDGLRKPCQIVWRRERRHGAAFE